MKSPSPDLSPRSIATSSPSPPPAYSYHASRADNGSLFTASASRHASPIGEEAAKEEDGEEELERVNCLWKDCGIPFHTLESLIEHIHSEHIGTNKSHYTCEWMTCPRMSIPQTSRFALISHMRSHTGEKPFVCHLPECDKSFTRSDALAKHMRLQHNILPPLPGRGGNRKRKRDDDTEASRQGFSTFKIDDIDGDGDESDGYTQNPRGRVGGPYTNGTSTSNARPRSPDVDSDDGMPQYLLQQIDPLTGNILGRHPALVRYLIMKSRLRYAMEQHEMLLEELRICLDDEQEAWDAKEQAMDRVLLNEIGPTAESLMIPIIPTSRETL